MIQSNNSNEDSSHKLVYCPIDFEMLPIDEFKVLGCGHCFCEKCLEEWANQGLQKCPKCRTEERRDVNDLNDIHSFDGLLLVEDQPEEKETLKLDVLVHRQFARRAETIR